jgi:double-strand break repair protein MRE11
MEPLKLRTVRPFVFEDIILNDYNNQIAKFKSRSEAVEEFIDNYIENELIPKATKHHTGSILLHK